MKFEEFKEGHEYLVDSHEASQSTSIKMLMMLKCLRVINKAVEIEYADGRRKWVLKDWDVNIVEYIGQEENGAKEFKYKKGRWYKGCDTVTLCSEDSNYLFGHGVGFTNEYHNDDGEWDGDYTEITPEQAGERLIEICKKKGYEKSVTVKDLNLDVIYTITHSLVSFNGSKNKVYMGNVCIFDINKGFAEIVKEEE